MTVISRNQSPRLFFHLSPEHWPEDLAATEDENWPGYRNGVTIWTLRTYHELRKTGYDCSLVREFPDEGIIIAHRASLHNRMRPTAAQLLVCIAADWGRHPFSQVHIVQSPLGARREGIPLIERYFMPGRSYHIRHWTQPGLIPRDPSRGNTLEHLVFFGRRSQLAPELTTPRWTDFLERLGLTWTVVDDLSPCSDYRDIDATVFIRGFGNESWGWKPGLKLFNSWRAGVIPICGPEPSYLLDRNGRNDSHIVSTYAELCRVVERLVREPEFRRTSFEASRSRAGDFSRERMVKDWIHLIETDLREEYDRWRSRSRVSRTRFFLARSCSRGLRGIAWRMGK